jgi:hypothetical protein
MIKHRFILRSWEEAEVFASIPTEHVVLQWTRWRAPMEQAKVWFAIEACRSVAIAIQDVLDPLSMSRDHFSEDHEATETIRKVSEELRACESGFLDYQKTLVAPGGDRRDVPQATYDEIVRKASETLDLLLLILRPMDEVILARSSKKARVYTERIPALRRSAEEFRRWFSDLRQENPPTELVCPVGVPFAHYTVEIPDPLVAKQKSGELEGPPFLGPGQPIVFEVIEGKAWCREWNFNSTHWERACHVEREYGAPLHVHRRVVEMITQMLTERTANPKAETRVVLRETDPAHGARVRQAEERDAGEPRTGTPKLRTIKFEVSPPRYLRQAAERIRTSKVRAHWVIGHWRNQACGEGRKQYREVWIAPHIRGLGEAGAIAAKVAAPKQTDPPTFQVLQ